MTGHLRVSMATVTTAPDESYLVELRGLEPLTPCLQSTAKLSSTVHDLA